jgi:hypothetical protein
MMLGQQDSKERWAEKDNTAVQTEREREKERKDDEGYRV